MDRHSVENSGAPRSPATPASENLAHRQGPQFKVYSRRRLPQVAREWCVWHCGGTGLLAQTVDA